MWTCQRRGCLTSNIEDRKFNTTMKKTVYIKLKRETRINPNPASNPATYLDIYRVESLRNAAQVWASSKPFRVGDLVTPEQADTLCEAQFYEVTINN